jgi:hypothetical protein
MVGSFKAQSAMEYLMTYGWAILIIAVVLAALFALGEWRIAARNKLRSILGIHVHKPGYEHRWRNLIYFRPEHWIYDICTSHCMRSDNQFERDAL